MSLPQVSVCVGHTSKSTPIRAKMSPPLSALDKQPNESLSPSLQSQSSNLSCLYVAVVAVAPLIFCNPFLVVLLFLRRKQSLFIQRSIKSD